MRYRRHVLEIYGVVLWHATTLAQYRSLNRRELDNSLPDSPLGTGSTTMGTRDGTFEVAIYTQTQLTDELTAIRICIHEAVHAAGSILDSLGQKDENDRGSEAMAYLTEWIAGWLMEGIARHYPKKPSIP